ncbi:methyltransferase domain-containing protein [Micromonospora sp. WMMA1363]|uniref:methyltransferase domain-containing protein n=1 Tax=Micromonospora sp. WMMA1363 TaxID=3053985 RepID=UPI00259CEC08|nr:methyltransferase domain-containing protein [Micromonospora sp. WMMA1363]MDM4723037.1 methyltransferase domain-containing protein [Micromonospora sp. WMMA1363]
MKKPTPNEIGQGYDAFTDLLDQLWGENLHHGYWEDASDDVSVKDAADRLTDKLAGLLTIEPGDRLLDLGCGIGEPAIRLATAHKIEIVGVSISGRQVERAHDRAVSAGLADRLSFQLADAMDLPFPEESFDIVWALESLHHMPDRAHVLRQATRVLRPGGRVAIGDFMLQPSADGYEAGAARVNEASKGVLSVIGRDAYLAMIREAGLVPVASEDVSRHTRPSWVKAGERFAALREQAVPHIGEEQFDLTLARFRAFSEEPALGYALLTARKPS